MATTEGNQVCQVWQTTELAQTYLEGVRGAIPLAAVQLELLWRLIALGNLQVKTFLDLGCGDGILGRTIHQHYPQAKGIFLDLSESMLQAAKDKAICLENCEFVLQDFGDRRWRDGVNHAAPFEVIVSGFSIHHQPDQRKREIYGEIYELLVPGGIFLNLEHVASHSPLGQQAFDELFVDSLLDFHQRQGNPQSRAEIDQQYYNRQDKIANILAPVEGQCDWLRQIGYIDVDCYFKLLEIALLGGRRPL
ncbi:MAG: class I SAM-dependent methyltransferase [Chloroflexaceae bacterium]|nr:class I SAM-dependent methyltransferase [Chloroflexaceae bacterium]